MLKNHTPGFWVAAGLMLTAAAVAGCDDSSTKNKPDGLNPGAGAPAVSSPPTAPPTDTKPAVTQLRRVDVNGLKAVLAEAAARKEVVILDFWATWCVPCVEMFPEIHEGAKKLGDKVRVITVTLDGEDEERAAIQFLEKHHALSDAYMMDPDPDKQLAFLKEIGKNWNALVVPALFVYGQDGKLVEGFTQGVKSQAVLDVAKSALNSR